MFDSSQFAELKRAVEEPFWRSNAVQARLDKIFDHPENAFCHLTPR